MNKKIIKYTIDKEVDAGYIYLQDINPGDVKRTENISSKDFEINLDFDSNDNLLGIEILGILNFEKLSI